MQNAGTFGKQARARVVARRRRAKTLETWRRTGLNWTTAVAMIVFHTGAVVALFNWSWTGFLVMLFLLWVSGGLGIGVGYHRLLTHRGFKTSRAFEYFLALCGTLALEGGPINWVATHRIHHAHADDEGDPHSPRDGRWWSHIGWILVGTAQQHPEATLRRYAPDLMKDRVHRVINRFYYVPLIASGVVLYALGGWPWVLWGVFLRVTIGLHATWLVNSATHMWGQQRFQTRDDSRNNWWVALLTFGEGWHNNHHAHPTSARHGLAWYEIDINWWTIRALQALGLIHSVKQARVTDER
ncbi:MAG: acyl-CoA desaturase [Pyrinomonas sp.]|uniref:acyl-CoA desaturase n=1 Tax=Pyrinomonas sp. TaxID=2080306 RepID=UPI00332781CC